MKYYFYSALLILVAVILAATLPLFLNYSENILVNYQIPQNNSQIAGIQKYNIPPASKGLLFPDIGARSILIKDLATGTILYQRNIHTPLPIASTTKIMTAVVASEYFKPNSVLAVGRSADIVGSSVGFSPDEDFSFRALLYGMLLNSGNDAAYAIAENYPGGITGFIAAMNQKVVELGLNNTHFDNPAGFDSPNHYSSAYDLAITSEEALKDASLSRIFATKETSIVSLNKKSTHQLTNLNKLLSSVKGVLGIKTGTTEGAKENLVTLVERDNHRILIVLLGSTERFSETTKLIDWIYGNFHWF